MTTQEKENWRINIENAISFAEEHCDAETVQSVFRRYDATCFDDLSPADYWAVFGDLEQMANDY